MPKPKISRKQYYLNLAAASLIQQGTSFKAAKAALEELKPAYTAAIERVCASPEFWKNVRVDFFLMSKELLSAKFNLRRRLTSGEDADINMLFRYLLLQEKLPRWYIYDFATALANPRDINYGDAVCRVEQHATELRNKDFRDCKGPYFSKITPSDEGSYPVIDVKAGLAELTARTPEKEN